MRQDGQLNCFLIQFLCCCASTDTTTVLPAGMFGDPLLSFRGTTRIDLSHSFGEAKNILLIDFLSAQHGSSTAHPALFRISLAFLFCLLDSFTLKQETLPFVPFAGPTPFEHDRGKPRVLSGPPGQCGIAGGQEYEMIEICACEAKRTLLPMQHDPGVTTEFLATLIASRFTR